MAEALGTYGYAMSVFVPVSFLCLIPVGILRWILVAGAAGSSGYFLYVSLSDCQLIISVQNIYPVLQSVCHDLIHVADGQADNKMSRLLILGVVGLHAIMALAMKILFFS